MRSARSLPPLLLACLLCSCTWSPHTLAAAHVHVGAQTPLPPCSTDEEKQFSVTVTTSEPLGLRLNDKLEVIEFVADAQGRSRAVEASGHAEIGDRLVQVNDESLLGRSLADAVAALTSASLPKVLRFQTHDGRCQVPPASAPAPAGAPESHRPRALQTTNSDTAASKPSEDGAAEAMQVFDYLLLSMGEKDSESTFFGVLSADGKPPSCSFREVEVAFPFDACSSLSTNATDKYVIVPTMSGCPAHQKATFAQDAGARGVIFVQHEGKKPQQIKVPAELSRPIVLPLVMVTMDSGVSIIEQISRAHPTQTPRIRFVFSAECASNRFEVHPDADPLALSVEARIESALAGFLTVTTADSGSSALSTTAFEFLKPSSEQASATLPLGKHDLVLPDRTLVRPCTDRQVVTPRVSGRRRADNSEPLVTRALREALQDQWVAVSLESKCGIAQQLAYFANMRVSGVVFADAAFPAAAHARATARAALQMPVPFVIVSRAALTSIASIARADSTMHIQVEFTGENALQHHWSDLAELAEPMNWPSSEIGRDRLFHRVLKDHAAVRDEDAQLHLARNERYDALIALYWRAQRFYSESDGESSRGDAE